MQKILCKASFPSLAASVIKRKEMYLDQQSIFQSQFSSQCERSRGEDGAVGMGRTKEGLGRDSKDG